MQVELDSIGRNRLYSEFSDLWPLLSPPGDYAEEASQWREILRGKLGPGRHRILELGVGGGHNLSHLAGDFEATAVDISESMLECCRRLNPGVELIAGDMRSVRIGRRFDAVLAHDAISHMRTEQDLRGVFATAAAHLEPGGVFITGPDHFRDTFKGPLVEHGTHSDGETELTYIEYDFAPDPENSGVEHVMFYLIRKSGRLRIEIDRLSTGLFRKETWLRLLDQSGFEVEERVLQLRDAGNEHTLFVGTLRQARDNCCLP